METVARVYILASRYRGTLYTGVTDNLARRVWQHRNNHGSDFTAKYRIHMLVYTEPHGSFLEARRREALIKRWLREWKFRLIEEANPDWLDLYDRIAS